ncbi:NUDIX hydrolase [Thalassotalea castellviae]|uniref:Phosphatase NudJ n=1 Tax=Thalassotalea castellviae TaxID=3075612 RepID=A0ABU3A5U8_9GAMM|nr:NUDIX hydrolase [Thalassotalea sp. W431]MDT0605210.1 NUDIX hydrolase [Thalassotalea sp. W431]
MSHLTQGHGSEQFKPNTTVAAVIVHQDKFLLVEEIENNQRVFNQAAGHLEANENLIDAAKREVFEETGLLIEPQYCSGIYYFHRPEIALYFLRFCFVIELTEPLKSSPNDEEIIATHWLTYDEIKSKETQLRSPMVLQCIDDYLAGQKVTLDIFKTNL